MFITKVSRDRTVVAEVECRENQVTIRTQDEQLRSDLEQVYRQNMNMVDFARANYCLNRWRADNLSWELVFAGECHSQVC